MISSTRWWIFHGNWFTWEYVWVWWSERSRSNRLGFGIFVRKTTDITVELQSERYARWRRRRWRVRFQYLDELNSFFSFLSHNVNLFLLVETRVQVVNTSIMPVIHHKKHQQDFQSFVQNLQRTSGQSRIIAREDFLFESSPEQILTNSTFMKMILRNRSVTTNLIHNCGTIGRVGRQLHK